MSGKVAAADSERDKVEIRATLYRVIAIPLVITAVLVFDRSARGYVSVVIAIAEFVE